MLRVHHIIAALVLSAILVCLVAPAHAQEDEGSASTIVGSTTWYSPKASAINKWSSTNLYKVMRAKTVDFIETFYPLVMPHVERIAAVVLSLFLIISFIKFMFSSTQILKQLLTMWLTVLVAAVLIGTFTNEDTTKYLVVDIVIDHTLGITSDVLRVTSGIVGASHSSESALTISDMQAVRSSVLKSAANMSTDRLFGSLDRNWILVWGYFDLLRDNISMWSPVESFIQIFVGGLIVIFFLLIYFMFLFNAFKSVVMTAIAGVFAPIMALIYPFEKGRQAGKEYLLYILQLSLVVIVSAFVLGFMLPLIDTVLIELVNSTNPDGIVYSGAFLYAVFVLCLTWIMLLNVSNFTSAITTARPVNTSMAGAGGLVMATTMAVAKLTGVHAGARAFGRRLGRGVSGGGQALGYIGGAAAHRAYSESKGVFKAGASGAASTYRYATGAPARVSAAKQAAKDAEDISRIIPGARPPQK